MPTSEQILKNREFLDRAIETTIRVGLVLLVAAWCFRIIRPFIDPVVWGIIIAVAVHPLYLRLQLRLGDRPRLAAAIFTMLALVLLIAPTLLLLGSLVDSAEALSKGLHEGRVLVPSPPESVASWPVVGEQLHDFWQLASRNLEVALEQMRPHFKAFGTWLLSKSAGAGLGFLQFLVAILLAGVFLLNADKGRHLARMIASRLVGEKGQQLAELIGATVRSVARGVVGVAFIQSILAGIGLLAIDVPGAGIWALLILILAVVQLPPIIILGPVMVYVFYTADIVPAVLFIGWSLFVSVSDTFLKPLLLGRGVEIPMLVILLGAIGGVMVTGIIGLFTGSVVLAVGYKLFVAWLYMEESAGEEQGEVAS